MRMEAHVSALGNVFVLQSDLITTTCTHTFRVIACFSLFPIGKVAKKKAIKKVALHLQTGLTVNPLVSLLWFSSCQSPGLSV